MNRKFHWASIIIVMLIMLLILSVDGLTDEDVILTCIIGCVAYWAIGE